MRTALFALAAVLMAGPALADEPCHAKTLVLGDGSVRFAGERFQDIDALRARMTDYHRQNPDCLMVISESDRGDRTKMDRTARALRKFDIDGLVYIPPFVE